MNSKCLRRSILPVLFLVPLQACMDSNDTVNPVSSLDQARKIADKRFIANAKALGSKPSQMPEPIVTVREKDYLFSYEDRVSRREIEVIVGKDGGISDSFQ